MAPTAASAHEGERCSRAPTPSPIASPAASPRKLEPVSILKPVKGIDEGLEENLETFFRLDYPRYELLFSVADSIDPAIPVIERLISKHTKLRARLYIGEIRAGPNPKVNNLIRSYGEARHDWILISDSNVRAEPGYLRAMVEPFDESVGVVTALVSGRGAASAGAWLESVFLNTFYARWMLLAQWSGCPIVIGKSMLFRRSEAQRFGGISMLSSYLAEDYVTGQAMRFLGRRIVLMREPVMQHIGRYGLEAFWSRHLRWGRIRKAQAPLAFAFEPLLSFWFSGLLGAWAGSHAFGASLSTWLAAHLVFWFSCDLGMMTAMGMRPSWRSSVAWIVRECLYFPLWLHIAMGSTVNWRGTRLTLARGGTIVAAR